MEVSEPTAVPVPIVAIGASAGGLGAIEELLGVLISRSAAYVVIQHLSPDYESRMDDILSRVTHMPVVRASDGLTLEAGTVYVMQPGTEMLVSNSTLVLTERSNDHQPSYPIDGFFRSAAQDAGPLSVGVVLSGTGTDGTRGLREIHEAGGLTVCQDPSTAAFSGMPMSALDSASVDLSLAPKQMAGPIHRYLKEERSAIGSGGANRELIGRATKLLREQTDVDFTAFKLSTLERRLKRRILLGDDVDLKSYIERLERDDDELRILYKDLLIGVTRFFRDSDVWEALSREFLKKRMVDESDEALRVWVPGCASGEEAYTIAILIDECARQLGIECDAKIFATDVDPRSLETATRGTYHRNQVEGVSEERLGRYFRRTGDDYTVNESLRRMVVVATHDLVRSPPFTRMDLISCRNVLIYLRPAVQRRVLSHFLFGLRPGGGLVLGRSETTRSLSDEFTAINQKRRIYFKEGMSTRPVATEPYKVQNVRSVTPVKQPASGPSLLQSYDELLARFMPTSLLISRDGALLHSFGGASRFLTLRDGRPARQVTDMLPPSLGTAIKETLAELPASGGEQKLELEFEGRPCVVSLAPLSTMPASPLLLIIHRAGLAADVADDEPENDRQSTQHRVANLELQLIQARDRLQSSVEQLETSNEELQSSNEELMASNEELQSTNEELQSVNEELHTVNAELEKKVGELTEMTHDMENLLRSMEVGPIFLDKELAIRRTTPMAQEHFRIQQGDIGRKLEDFKSNLRYDTLNDDLRQVLRNGARLDREVRTRDGKWFLLRLRPYLVASDILGVVMTLIDVDAFKAVEESVRKAVVRRDEYIAVLSHELRNPLSAIVSAVDLSRSRGKNQLDGKILDIVDRQSRHLSRILDDLLDFSRAARGKLELRRSDIDLRTILEQSADGVSAEAQRRGVKIEVVVPGSVVGVHADPDRLQQVVTNLLRNAIKCSPEGSAVRLGLSSEDDEAVISVRDEGIGIEADMLDQVFEPFVQANGPRASNDGEMGIGLSIVQHLVGAHGGQVSAYSPGKDLGSEFVARLPMSAPTEVEEALPAARQGEYLLLVEDEPDARATLAALLEGAGFDVIAVADGNRALDKIADALPRAALIDIGIPGPDGYAVAEVLQRASSEIPTIALTGLGGNNERRTALESGFDEHMTKPVSWDDLKDTLDRLL